MKHKKIKSLIGVIGILFLTTIMIGSMTLTSCGTKESYDNAANDSAKMEDKMDRDSDGGEYGLKNIEVGGNQEEEKLDRKIILRKNYTIETLDFDKDRKAILEKMKECGGYVERSEVNGNSIDDTYSRKYAEIVIRIPRKNFNNFVNSVEENMHVLRTFEDSSDVTFEFYDTEARLETLKVQEERLLEILKKSGEMKDIIEVEKALQEVRYNIESNTTTIKRLSNLVDYTTITIELREVRRVTKVVKKPESLGTKIKKEFQNSMYNVKEFGKDCIIWVIGSIPYLIVYLPLIIIFIVLIRIIRGKKNKINKNKRKNNDKKMKENSESKED